MAPASQSYESLPTSTKALAGIPPPKPDATADVSGVPEVKDLAQNLEQPSLKRKEVESSGSNRFKIVSQLVIAMRRFQGERLHLPQPLFVGFELITALQLPLCTKRGWHLAFMHCSEGAVSSSIY